MLLFAHDSRILPGIGQQALAGVCAHQDQGVKLVNMEDSVVEALCEKLRLKKVEGKEGIYVPEGNLFLWSQLIYLKKLSISQKFSFIVIFPNFKIF